MGMHRDQRNLHKTGAALALAPFRKSLGAVSHALLACSLLGTVLPASSHEVPAGAAPAASAAPTDTAHRAVPADTARPAPSRPDVPATRTTHPTPSRGQRATAADPFVCALVGIIPLSSGYYLTSAPRKGVAFSLADAVLIGSIWNIRRDDDIPDGDVTAYFYLLGAVNVLDAVLSGLQARHDAVRVRTTLTPSGEPMVGLAWTF